MKFISALICAAALTGCAAMEHDRQLAAKPGVQLGMSRDQVLHETSWGEPITVNRTVTSGGTHEQWVYSGHNYLYFTNGKVSGVQN